MFNTLNNLWRQLQVFQPLFLLSAVSNISDNFLKAGLRLAGIAKRIISNVQCLLLFLGKASNRSSMFSKPNPDAFCVSCNNCKLQVNCDVNNMVRITFFVVLQILKGTQKISNLRTRADEIIYLPERNYDISCSILLIIRFSFQKAST